MHNNILDFILLDENNAPILNYLGLPTLKTGHVPKTESDLLRVISLGQPVNVINAFAQEFIDSEQWEWANKYYGYLVELNEVEQYNGNLPDPIPTEDGVLIEVEPKALPTEPERPAVRTVDEVLEPYKVTIFKRQRQSQIDNAVVEISTGKTFDADEQSITRLANAIIKHWSLEPTDIIPWSTADVGTGEMVECTKAEIMEAHQLATDNFAATWQIPD